MSDLQQGINQIIDAAGLRAAREIAYAEFKKTQAVGKLTKQLSKVTVRSGKARLMLRSGNLN